MPYLPPADPDVTELDCILVYFPNAPEYRQALFGQLAELTDVWNWGGSRATQAIVRRVWLAAEQETLDNMGCFDEVLAELVLIRGVATDILNRPCCPSNVLPPPTIDGVGWDPTGLPGDIPTDDVTVGVGDPPVTEWTDPDGTGITWGDYNSYLCGAANVYLDGVLTVAQTLKYVSVGLVGVSNIASYYFDTIVDLLGVDVPLWLNSDLLLDLNSLLGDFSGESWDNIIDDIVGARDTLVCAILASANATEAASAFLTELGNLGLSAPVIAALGFPVSMMNVLFQGGIRAEYGECDCEGQTVLSEAMLIQQVTWIGANDFRPRILSAGSQGSCVAPANFGSPKTMAYYTATPPIVHNLRISGVSTPPPVAANATTTLISPAWSCIGLELKNDYPLGGRVNTYLEMQVSHVYYNGAWRVVVGLDEVAANVPSGTYSIDGNKVIFENNTVPAGAGFAVYVNPRILI